MAKVIIHSTIEWVASRHTGIQLHQYVDDLTQRGHGTTAEVVVSLPPAAVDLLQSLRALGFTISSKSTIAASNVAVAARRKQAIAEAGLVLPVANSVRDLGIDATGTSQRCLITARKREAKAGKSMARVKRLGRVSFGVIRHLWKAGPKAQMVYHAPAVGVTPARATRLRTDAAIATQAWRPGRCITTAICLVDGIQKGPLRYYGLYHGGRMGQGLESHSRQSPSHQSLGCHLSEDLRYPP